MTRAYLLFCVLLSVLSAGALTLVACSSGMPPLSGTGGDPASAGGSLGSCSVPREGCGCPTEGELIDCGEVSGVAPDGRPVCAEGYRRCISGAWSRCDALDHLTNSDGKRLHLQDVGFDAGNEDGGACSVCDPYCRAAQQTEADGGLVAARGGALFDAALDGPPDPTTAAILSDAGISIDGIFHQLTPDASAFDPITVTTNVNSVDVYFLLNSTASTQASIGQLATAIPNVVSSIQSTIPNVAFGLGRFTNYQAWPYASQSNGNTVFANMQNLSTNAQLTVNKLQAMPTNAGGVCQGDPSCFQNTPYVVGQSTTTALYAMATNESLVGWAGFSGYNSSDWWWNVYRSYGQRSDAWSAPFVSPNGGCAAGTIGAACFRPSTFHVVMVLEDAPMQSGPGGSFPYYQMKPLYFPYDMSADYTTENSWYWYYSQSLGGTTSTPSLPPNNGATPALTIPSGGVGKASVQFGNVQTGVSNYQLSASTVYDPSAKMKCTLRGATMATGPDVTWDFSVPAGGSQRLWFDTVGTAYDTVLYVIDRNSGNVMACADDSFPWLSAQNIGLPSSVQGIAATESAILGNLPPGDYRLVLDKYDATAMPTTPSNTGIYEINMWMDITDPRMAGNPKMTGVTTPGYSQMLSALKAPNLDALVMGIEMSGADCGQTPNAWEKNWTRWSLEGLAKDTGAVVGGVPQVYSVKQDGSPGPVSGGGTAKCPAGANLGSIVSNAIQNLTGNLAQQVTVKVTDSDDATDFDGTKGVSAGNTVLTPVNIDDATFVAGIVANPATGCIGPTSQTSRVAGSGTTSAGYASCGPGAVPNLTFNFTVPPTVTPGANAQIFRFYVEVYFGSSLMQRTPVVLVVPPVVGYAPTDFIRDIDATYACNGQQVVKWGTLTWNKGPPCQLAGGGAADCIPLQSPPAVDDTTDAEISFYLTLSGSSIGVDGGVNGPKEFSVPIFMAHNATQTGAADVGAFLKTATPKAPAGDLRHLRLRAHLDPTADGLKTPVLANWSLTIDCQDAQ